MLARTVTGLYKQTPKVVSESIKALSAGAEFKLPDMPYDYGALEPYINARIMELHHSKHHATYVSNLNAALEKYEAAEKAGDLATCLSLQAALKFNGGGHINHSIFWTNLAPPSAGGGGEPEGELANRIKQQWGDFETFKTKFNASAAGIQGSGWAWLGYTPEDDRLVIRTCANQDPLAATGAVPLLGIDMWEHAFYLQYENKKPDYLKEIWNVINFANVNERLADATKK